MERGNYDCKEVIKASKKNTVNVYLPYKTPILQGAIRIITEFKKRKEDGVDYKKLCKELSKYVNVQKGCIDPNLKSADGTKFKKQWKNIIESLNTTFTTQNIVKLCYWEGDKGIKNKERILDLNDKFRKFCIEKKPYEVKSSNMNSEECIQYIQWIEAKKKEFQSLDPRYTTIEQYQEYFNVRSNCNYQWLANDKPDMICTRTTRTKPSEINSKGTTLGDTTHKPSSDVTHIKVADDHKDTTLASKPPSTENMHNPSTKSPGTGHEQITNKGLPNAGVNTNNELDITKIGISGTPVSDSPPVFPPTTSKLYPDYSDPELQKFIGYYGNNLDGQKIPYDVHHPINKKPVNFHKTYPLYAPNTPNTPIIAQPFNFNFPSFPRTQEYSPPNIHTQNFPTKIPHSHGFPKIYLPRVNYFPISKSIKNHVSFFPPQFPPFRIITSGIIKNYYYSLIRQIH